MLQKKNATEVIDGESPEVHFLGCDYEMELHCHSPFIKFGVHVVEESMGIYIYIFIERSDLSLHHVLE